MYDSTCGYATGAGKFAMLVSVHVEAFANQCYHFTQWSDGITDNPRMLLLTKDTLLSALFDRDAATTGTETVTACDSYIWKGTTYTSSGTNVYQTTNAAGCDSVVTLNLAINYSNSGDTTATACDSFTWWNTNYTYSTNAATHVFRNAAGCDSTVTLHLTINYSNSGDTSATACDSFTWWNTDYMNSTNSATHVLTNAAGCDSTVTLHLTINHSTTIEKTFTACDSMTWNGELRTQSGVYTYQTINSAGCDSIVTLYLTINYSTETTVMDTADNSYTWHDSTYTESGTYLWQGTTEAGCDSTVTLMLVINQVGIEVIDGSGMVVKVYPNPTTGLITIDADDVVSVEVIDQAGRKVATFNGSNRIDLGGLTTGYYILKIHLTRGQSVQRIILR